MERIPSLQTEHGRLMFLTVGFCANACVRVFLCAVQPKGCESRMRIISLFLTISIIIYNNNSTLTLDRTPGHKKKNFAVPYVKKKKPHALLVVPFATTTTANK